MDNQTRANYSSFLSTVVLPLNIQIYADIRPKNNNNDDDDDIAIITIIIIIIIIDSIYRRWYSLRYTQINTHMHIQNHHNHPQQLQQQQQQQQ